MPPLRISSIFGFNSSSETSVTRLPTIDIPLAGELVPRHLPRAHGNLDRVDAEQTDAAQDERENVDVEIGGHGVAAGGDQAAVLCRFKRGRKNIAADSIDDTGPSRFLQRAAGSIVRFFTGNDRFGAQASQKIMLARFSSRGDDIET